ncbi:MAG: MFS transporter [Clostridiales bacterium]|nr:MFS transporter [Clostridiales bacterium]
MTGLLLAVIYLAFISLGLPDSLLGSAWPSMYTDFNVPISWAGIISMITAAGTIASSLQSDRLTKKLGAGIVTAISVAMTAAALLGFSISRSFWMLCLWAIPYGLGAGSVDAALNNYVALHFKSSHMSWLHCMWGVGTSIGPYIMSYALTGGRGWGMGYRYIAFLQIGLTAILVFSLPLWKGRKAVEESKKEKPLSLKKIVKIPGAKEVMVTFFCYCALESTAILWSASYMAIHRGISPDRAAGLAALFFIGITAGRGINGFLTYKFSDTQMIRTGMIIIGAGALAMLLPLSENIMLGGLLLMGLGCAPIYPCIIHSTPAHFGADKSQALIGVQMASAYTGSCLMPPVFGVLANNISISLFPFYIAAILALMCVMHERLVKKCPVRKES